MNTKTLALALALGASLALAGAARAAPKHAAPDTALIEQLTGAKGQLDEQDLARGLRNALDRTATRAGTR